MFWDRGKVVECELKLSAGDSPNSAGKRDIAKRDRAALFEPGDAHWIFAAHSRVACENRDAT